MTKPGFADSYHQATKHHPHRYARSAGYMDWPNQPNPFLRFEEAQLFELPLTRPRNTPRYSELYHPGCIRPASFDLDSLGCLLQYAFGISAWKEHQSAKWELRCNPSSGNLHPTECYVVTPALTGLSDMPGVYHYAPKEHGLEQRCILNTSIWPELIQEHREILCLVGLSGIYWREAWKYGERAYRYCQLDAGHALAALSYSAAALGWRCVLLEDTSDSFFGALLGCHRKEGRHQEEPERPEALCAILPVNHLHSVKTKLNEKVEKDISSSKWYGTPIQLSQRHHPWDIIENVAAACEKPSTKTQFRQPVSEPTPTSDVEDGHGAHPLILQRRSAQMMDGESFMTRDHFYSTLERCMPNSEFTPWSAGMTECFVHLAIFVHRVKDLQPGLYILIRIPEDEAALRKELNPAFEWSHPPELSKGLPLYCLAREDLREIARNISCVQDIAGDGAFSLGMISRYREHIEKYGDWIYPWLYREAGMVGQVLYLEAEAYGLRGTGIGCFFDDLMHQVLGLNDNTFQSIYHFTVGKALLDTRLRTLPPYPSSRLQKEGE